jgi:hypothetical protein
MGYKFNIFAGTFDQAGSSASGGGDTSTFTARSAMLRMMGDAPDGIVQSVRYNANTQMKLGKVILPFGINATQITVRCSAVTTAGTLIITLYSEDGQTRYFSVTTPSIASANTQYKTSLGGAVALTAGIYYIAVVSVSSLTDVSLYGLINTPNAAWNIVSGKDTIEGDYTVTAATPPTTLTLSSISGGQLKTIIARLDA